ncbi:MAG: hypothetical protein K2Q26_03835 [Bdellovibrionales bacterium]|nr:hypothetical protein [Bdellovibrionales bacterium]
MDKVSGNLGYPVVILSPSSEPMSSRGNWERGSGITGHHSSVSKALDAHRMQRDERNTRSARHGGVAIFNDEQSGFDPNASVYINSSTSNPSAVNEVEELDFMSNRMIEPPTSMAKMASVESFKSLEQERPLLGEPVPKGSYLDIEA